MATTHSSAFNALCENAKATINEMTIEDYLSRQENDKQVTLIDVREESEWSRGCIPSAIHLGKGVIERDIEKTISDTKQCLVLYCGGGYRSALAAQSLQKMGYTNVYSLAGGWRRWNELGQTIDTKSTQSENT